MSEQTDALVTPNSAATSHILLLDDEDATSLGGAKRVGPNGAEESKRDRQVRLLTEQLAKIERDFGDQRESLFQAAMETIEHELEAIHEGTQADYVKLLQQLEAERDTNMARADSWRDYQLKCAEAIFRLETEQAELDYVAEREGVRDRMLQQIDERRKRLAEERESMTIDSVESLADAVNIGNQKYQSRKLRRRQNNLESGDIRSKMENVRAGKRNKPPQDISPVC